jgi:A/G-specific adenine glycosylase
VTRSPATIAPLLLAWYDRSRRDLPWRYPPGTRADPYRIWLSEIMLQQTTVKAVIPYFETFTTRWPDVAALAAAPLDAVLAAWAGLGYYSRARNLHACAAAVVAEHGGHFPADEAALLTLPGVGPYTAAAIAAIGHGQKATPIDGNIERVVTRLYAIVEPLPGAKPRVKACAQALTPEQRAGDFAQAMMDLGATVCTPRQPSCLICPLTKPCRARVEKIAADLPRKSPKPDRPIRYGTAFVVTRRDGAVLLRRRPESGLLGGMLEVPSTDWSEVRPGDNAIRTATPVAAAFAAVPGTVVHIFTHFRLELQVVVTRLAANETLLDAADPTRCRWVPAADLPTEALPTVMLKILAAAGLTNARRSRPPVRAAG